MSQQKGQHFSFPSLCTNNAKPLLGPNHLLLHLLCPFHLFRTLLHRSPKPPSQIPRRKPQHLSRLPTHLPGKAVHEVHIPLISVREDRGFDPPSDRSRNGARPFEDKIRRQADSSSANNRTTGAAHFFAVSLPKRSVTRTMPPMTPQIPRKTKPRECRVGRHKPSPRA